MTRLEKMTPLIYADVFDRLEREGVRYVVIGGVAIALRGHARAILDLDIIIDPAPDEAERAVRALSLAGFVPSIAVPLSALTVLRMFDQTQREVDVFLRYCIAFDELWAASGHVSVGESRARVASPEHLLRAEQFWTRVS